MVSWYDDDDDDYDDDDDNNNNNNNNNNNKGYTTCLCGCICEKRNVAGLNGDL
jgi:hypothetical protein